MTNAYVIVHETSGYAMWCTARGAIREPQNP